VSDRRVVRRELRKEDYKRHGLQNYGKSDIPVTDNPPWARVR